jgi:carboxylesterase
MKELRFAFLVIKISKNDSTGENLTLKGAGPFYFEGKTIGVLMLHGGGGGTAVDLKPLAKDIHNQLNCTVSVPLLPGYGTNPAELRTTAINQWHEFVRDEILKLKGNHSYIFIGGHSMGGLLSLIHAKEKNVLACFSISTPTGVRGFAVKLVPLLKPFLKYHSIKSEELRKETNGQWVGYDEVPINIITKVKVLIEDMKRSLPQVKCPVILFQGKKDSQIAKNSMEFIYEHLKSNFKKKIWLERNDHPILGCPDHDVIVKEISTFIKTISGNFIKEKNNL